MKITIDILFKNLSLYKALSISILLSLLFIYPLLQAGVYYEDDLFRIFTGQYVWEMLGRLLTFYLMHMITFSSDVMLNVTPLPLLLSAIIIAFMIIYVTKNILGKINLITLLVSFCFICNPYLLANLSYAYDCLHMVLGFYFSLISFVWIKNKKYTGILWLIGCFLLYQPMGNIFLSLIFFQIVINIYTKSSLNVVFKQFSRFIISYVLALILYLIIIKLFYLLVSFPLQRSEQLSLMELLNEILINRIYQLYNYLSVLYENKEGKIILVLLGITLSSSVYKLNGLRNSILLITGVIGLYLSLYGPMFLLKEGLMTARVMTSLGGIFLTVLYISLQLSYSKRIILNIFGLSSIIITFWYFMTLSFGYGNYLGLQRKYDENLLNIIQYDVLSLSQLDHSTLNKWIHIEGCSQKPKSIQLIEKLRPFYKQLHSPACSWRAKFIIYDSILGNFKFDRRWNSSYPELKQKICDIKLSPKIDKKLYSIYEADNFIFINLGKKLDCKSNK